LAAVEGAPTSQPQSTARPVGLRFEDVTQDGRLALEALPNAFGTVLWREILPSHPVVRQCLERGIVAILTRFVLEGTPGPFSGLSTLEAEAQVRVAWSADGRLTLDAWGEAYGPIGRTYGSVEGAGTRALAGTIFAEHTFTRLFGPPGGRRVRREDVADLAQHIEERRALAPPESLAMVPSDASAIDPEARPDGARTTFGLVHTDSNQHVNSLVYLRLFEEAALRRFAELGRPTVVLARRLEIAYRKPCFAGQTMRVVQQAFEQHGKLGVAAQLTEDPADATRGAEGARAHTFARLTFEP
jgi:Acyl-ACP thioesterase C-terminal domain